MSNVNISWQDRFSGSVLHAWARMTSRFSTFQVSGMDHLQAALERKRPLIFTAWHGMTMMLVGFFANHYDSSKLVPLRWLCLPASWTSPRFP